MDPETARAKHPSWSGYMVTVHDGSRFLEFDAALEFNPHRQIDSSKEGGGALTPAGQELGSISQRAATFK